MATWWAKRGRARYGATEDDDVDAVIDVDDGELFAPPVVPDPARMAQLAEFRRACAARDEALRDLQRLRERHWSGERLVEEGRTKLEWWEQPDADPHAVLGLLPGARLVEASAARRRIAMECHPDRLADNADPELVLRRMVAANAAYDRLRRALLLV